MERLLLLFADDTVLVATVQMLQKMLTNIVRTIDFVGQNKSNIMIFGR